jgi:cytochrome c peroxidase
MKKQLFNFSFAFVTVLLFAQCTKDQAPTPVPSTPTLTKVQLGKLIFHSTVLSNPSGQSCASCHASTAGFADPENFAVSPGINKGMFGNRNAPMACYATYTPSFSINAVDSVCIGGQFWDGRVNTLAEQATKPFFNPLEMNITDVTMFVSKLKSTTFYSDYVKIYGETTDEQKILTNVGDAIAAFESSEEVNPFSSKFDAVLKGNATFTETESKGRKLFVGKGLCASCHLIDPDEASGKILFTDFKFHNIGVPKNPNNPFYKMSSQHNPNGANFIDLGLGDRLKNPRYNGYFKCSSLRNIALTAPYMHNGALKTLEEVVHFYNSRDVDGTLAKPEVPEGMNTYEVGDLKLTTEEEGAIVAFLKTLTDGYK